MGKIIFGILVVLFIVCAVLSLCTGCRTTGTTDIKSGSFTSGTDYIKPESIDAANYAVNERIYYLERELELAHDTNRRLTERLNGARATAIEIAKSSETIGELGRRSTSTVQEILADMASLILWIDWVTGRIQYLENLLVAEIQDKDMVEEDEW
jgi:hypothetical protein